MSTLDFFSKFDINILYEDDDFLVLEKPAGLLVHPTKYQKEKTLVDWLFKKFPEIKNVGEKERPGIIHRLDKDVSGLMVVAKTKAAYEHFVKQFSENKVKKEYLALVYGQPPEEKGFIDLPIGRTKKGKLIAVRYRKGIKLEKPAITEYEIISRTHADLTRTNAEEIISQTQAKQDQRKSASNFTLLKVKPLTGRTHQIRIHLASIGCPIVGDKNYLPKHLITQAPKCLNRIFLHASYLGFYDLKGNWREFRSELPEELKNFLSRLNIKLNN
jgi:23S rRNA pseudouridine1911/1915/1917 synthase